MAPASTIASTTTLSEIASVTTPAVCMDRGGELRADPSGAMAPKGKKPAPNPLAKKKAAAKSTNPLYEKRPKNFGVGGSLPVRKDLSRFMKWPKYVRLQRQKRILMKRLKVPPTINQFNKTLDKNVAENLFKLLGKYRPEDKAAKKERLLAEAAAQEKGQTVDKKKKKKKKKKKE